MRLQIVYDHSEACAGCNVSVSANILVRSTQKPFDFIIQKNISGSKSLRITSFISENKITGWVFFPLHCQGECGPGRIFIVVLVRFLLHDGNC